MEVCNINYKMPFYTINKISMISYLKTAFKTTITYTNFVYLCVCV